MQIVPGVFQVNGTPYGRPQNSYFVQAGDASFLIDSGDGRLPSCLPEIERNAARWGLSIDGASHLFLTHEHFDHASHAAAIRGRGVRVVASAPCADALDAADERCIGWMQASPFEPCVVDHVLAGGEELSVGGLGVRCIAAPGHSDGSVIYEIELNGEICWFSGDLVGTRVGHDGIELGWTGAVDFDKRKSIETFRSLIDRPCDNLFPGHGRPVIGGAKEVLGFAYGLALVEWR